LQLTKEAINSWSENIKSLGLNIDIEQINSTSLITPKQALLNLKSSGATTTNNYFNKIQLEKDITQLDLDLQIDEQKKILDRLDISYDKKDDGDKVYSLSLTFNIPFLEGDIARNNFKNVRSNQKIQQLKKEALFAKFNSKKIINNFTFKSQKLQKDLNDIISLRKKVRSFKKNNFKMYKTLYEHLIKKQLRYFAHYREFIGLYLQQLNFSNVKLSTDNDYLKAM